MSQHINLKVTKKQSDFLKKVAMEQDLMKHEDQPSEAKALKYLLDKWIYEEESAAINSDEKTKIQELLEQINILMPQLVFYGLINAKLSASEMNSDTYQQLREIALKETAKVCGHIQKQEYKHLYVANDSKNMKTIPIEEHENKWKLS